MSGSSSQRARIAVGVGVLALIGGQVTAAGPSYAAGQLRGDLTAPGRLSEPPRLIAVTATSATNAWAVGSFIAHWDGRKWRTQSSPSTGTCLLHLQGVTAISPRDAWAVGWCRTGASTHSIIEHWNGRRWGLQAWQDPGRTTSSEVAGVTATSASRAWAVGSYDDSHHRASGLIETGTGAIGGHSPTRPSAGTSSWPV